MFDKTLTYTINATLGSRMGAEAYNKALEQQKNITQEAYGTIKYLAEFAVRPMFRTPRTQDASRSWNTYLGRYLFSIWRWYTAGRMGHSICKRRIR